MNNQAIARLVKKERERIECAETHAAEIAREEQAEQEAIERELRNLAQYNRGWGEDV